MDFSAYNQSMICIQLYQQIAIYSLLLALEQQQSKTELW